ncbi:Lsm14 N-terminal [Dichotomocladium elegans]|nr:Lsm14 N-terminal [Dichotomocladium elegans]
MSDQRYVGSRISLVSKSGIRYIGILNALDPQNATLSLKEVVSQGTEGRRGGNPADEIPPSDTVFKYIVFRGSDIKDLSVFDLPPQQKKNQQQASPSFGVENHKVRRIAFDIYRY